jgi:hypothetical protein
VYLVLGGDTDEPLVLEQVRGTFIGGRFSRTKTAIFLGRRIRCYFNDPPRVRNDRFVVEGLPFRQAVACILYVDDGSFGSFVWCRHCLYTLAVKLWGSDMAVSEEEHGDPEARYRMRFLDSFEEYEESSGLFYLLPVGKNMEPLRVGRHVIPITRFSGPAFVESSHRYLRSLILGRLARLHQLLGEDHSPVVPNVGTMLVELLQAGYSARQLRTAMGSLRQAWAQPAVSALRKVLADAL